MPILLDHTKRTDESIGLLLQSDHYESALILIYGWIDRMSWLSTSESESTGQDFKEWVNKYLLVSGKLQCTAEDLWSARCAVLHTSTSYSRDTNKGKAKRVQYISSDLISVTKKPEDTTFINIFELYKESVTAVLKFDCFLGENEQEKEIARKKLSMFFSLQELNSK